MKKVLGAIILAAAPAMWFFSIDPEYHPTNQTLPLASHIAEATWSESPETTTPTKPGEKEVTGNVSLSIKSQDQ